MKNDHRPFSTLALPVAALVSGLMVSGTLGVASLMREIQHWPRTAAKVNVVRSPLSTQGAKLFGMNCAHCHGIDATGDEGPDLHGLTKSDTRLKSIILTGVKGEMPAFNKKLNEQDATALVAYLRSLNG